MNWLEGIILGFVQGLTEFLPISSSGHLVLFAHWLDIQTPGIAFEGLLNFASLLAIVFFTWKDIKNITINTVKHVVRPSQDTKPHFKMGLLIVIGTIPAAVLGFIFEDMISKHLRSVASTAATLFITGTFLFLVRNIQGSKSLSTFSKKDGWVIGLAQALALIPGISRSGSPVVAALFLGIKKELAIRYSFLLSIPVGLGTMILTLPDLMESSLVSASLPAYIVMFIITFFATLIGIKLFVGTLRNNKLIYFAWYCWALSGLILISLLF